MIAEAITGDGDGALDYYLRINPSAREAISDVHRCEPYVYAQMIAGRDAPTHGEAKNSWLTGTAAWNMVAISQWILGIRPEHDGLRVEPVIPALLARVPGDAAVPRHDLRHRGVRRSRWRRPRRSARAACLRGRSSSTAARSRARCIPLPAPGTPRVRVEVRLA